MKKRYIPLLITLLFLGINSGSTFGQEGFSGGQRIQKQAPRRERQAKEATVKVMSVVKDANGKALANVLVSGKEGVLEVMTDKDGKFSITVPENSSLLFEADGYESKMLPITNTSPASVELKPTEFLMGEKDVVNIAFGKVKKKELIGAVSTLDTKELKKTDDTESFYDAIAGKIPGMMIGNNLVPGMTATSLVRGLTNFSTSGYLAGTTIYTTPTLTTGGPLIIIDGVARDPSLLNLSEIEQISVLKDGNAAMLWGSRAKSGVILITTRRGIANKRKVEVSYERGIQTPVVEPHYLSSAQYMPLRNEALLNDGLAKQYADTTIARYAAGTSPYRYPSIDYYNQFLKSQKPFQRILTEMSGGNDITQYYANIGWTRSGSLFNQGDAEYYSFNQFNMRANVDFKVNDFIKAAVDAIFIYAKDKQPAGDFWGNASTIHPDYFTPLLPISLLKKSPWTGITAGQLTALNNMPGQIRTAKKLFGNTDILGGTATYTSNPYGILYYSGYSMDNRRTAAMNASIETDLKSITPGLKFKIYMSLDLFNRYYVNTSQGRSYSIYNPTFNRVAGQDSIIQLTQTGTDVNPGTQSIPTYSTTLSGNTLVFPYFERRFGANAQFDYDRTFGGDHHVTSTLLAYWSRFRRDAVFVDKKDAYLGWRTTYDYKEKYMVDFTSTYTNNFMLKPGNRRGFEPSVGLAWNISEEPWMKECKNVDYLKLRFSLADQDVDPDLGTESIPWRNSFGTGSYFTFADGTQGGSGANTRGALINRSDNFALSYEKMKSANAGLEGYFFNKMLYVEANAFYNRWLDMVVRRTNEYPAWIAGNTSNLSPYENNNVTDYRGAEVGVNLTKNIGKFSIQFGGNMLYAESDRVKYSELITYPYLARNHKAGDALFGLVDLGLFKNAFDISNSPRQTWSAAKPGDIKYKDINGDGKIDGNDMVEIGHSLPRYSYGLNFIVKYSDFSLMATGDGAVDYQYLLSGSYFIEDGTAKYSSEVLNRWTPATALTANYPRMSSGTNTNNNQTSTYWLQDGTYFRLNRLQLSWDVPKTLIPTWPTKAISLYIRGSNFMVWSRRPNERQLNIAAEPNYHLYTLGVNLLF